MWLESKGWHLTPPAPLPACGERGDRVAVGEGFNGTIETALLTGLLQ